MFNKNPQASQQRPKMILINFGNCLPKPQQRFQKGFLEVYGWPDVFWQEKTLKIARDIN
jgi:hypothetical protein